MPDSEAASEPRDDSQCILVLPTTHHTLLAESILASVNIRHLSVPKPQKAASDCGMAILIEFADLAAAAEALKREEMKVDFFRKNSDDEIKRIKPGEIYKENQK